MDEGSGNGQTIVDQSGNGNNGTTNDGANNTGMDCTKQGKFGGGCEFDGADDVVAATDNNGTLSFPYSDLSIGAWVYPTGWGNGGRGAIFGKWGGSYNYSLRIIDSTPRLAFSMSGTGGNIGVSGTTDIPNFLNNWHYVQAVKTRTNVSIYVDGKLYASNNITDYSPYIVTSQALAIGSIIYYGTYTWSGLIDDFRIYNYARTPKQVVEDMNAGHPIGGSPVGSQLAYYKFDEGQGQSAYDFSPQKNNAQLGATSGVDASDPTWTNSGKFGKALSFDGGDYATSSNTRLDSRSFSITAWVYANNLSVDRCFFGQQESASTNKSLHLRVAATGEIRFGFYSNDLVSSAGTFQSGGWHYVGMTYDSLTKDRRIYYDGKLVASGTASSDYLGTIGSNYVGAWQVGSQQWNGYIDELKIYSSALTPEQIKLDMNQGKELQLGGQSSATGATGQAAEYCVPGDSDSTCTPPVGEWNFDENSGTDAHDRSGNGNDGVLGTSPNDPTWYDVGKNGSALNFDGTNDYVNMGDPTDGDLDVGTGDFTIESWFYTNNASANQDILVKGGMDGVCTTDGNQSYGIYLYSGKYRFKVNTGSVQSCQTLISNSNVTTGWHHLVATADRDGNMSIYIDGKFDNSTSMSSFSNTLDSSVDLRVGSFPGNPAYCPFSGKIDQVQLFKYVRTPAQIAWDYNRGKPVGWWKMDEGEGGSAFDSSGNGNTGTLTTMDPPNDWVDGKFGKALDFDGSDDYVSAPVDNVPIGGTPRTVSLWADVNDSSWAANSNTIFEYGTSSTRRAFGIDMDTYPNIEIYSWADDSSFDAGLSNNPGWTMITMTYDGNVTIKTYINGVLKNTKTLGGVLNTASSNISIGRSALVANDYFNSKIDDVRVYNYALTAEQVKQVMNEGSAVRFGE